MYEDIWNMKNVRKITETVDAILLVKKQLLLIDVQKDLFITE